MSLKISQIWDKYLKYYLENFAPEDLSREEGLPGLRDMLFVSIVLITFPVCIVVYIPSLIVSLVTKSYFIAVTDTVALLLLTLITGYRRFHTRNKKTHFIAIFYLLSVALMAAMGTKGPSIAIMFCISVMATLFQSRKAGLICTGLNGFIYFTFFVFLRMIGINLNSWLEYDAISGSGVIVNLLAFNAVAVIAVAFMVEKLNESLVKEKELQILSRINEQEIKTLNASLERKIAERTHELAETNERLVSEIIGHEKTEAELKQAKIEADSANRAKSDFLATMGHEIRTPMNSILGYSDLLNKQLTDKSHLEYIDSIKSSGKTLLTLINDILDLAKIEAGKLELQYDYIEARPFFSEFEKIFASKYSVKKLKFITQISDATPLFILVDRERLRQIVMNLVGNAVKFTDKGEVRLTVTAENKGRIKRQGNGDADAIDLVIEVSDTGIGIPEEFQSQIFGSFTQVKSKTNLGGTGLGLAITRQLLNMMRGNISLKSKPCEGSVFTVRIPEVICKSDTNGSFPNLQSVSSETVFEKDGTKADIKYPDLEGVKDLKGLLSSLEGSFMEVHKSFGKRQPINDVREFGKSLASLGEAHSCPYIADYGSEIVSAADSFNIGSILVLLGLYHEKIEALKKRQ